MKMKKGDTMSIKLRRTTEKYTEKIKPIEINMRKAAEERLFNKMERKPGKL